MAPSSGFPLSYPFPHSSDTPHPSSVSSSMSLTGATINVLNLNARSLRPVHKFDLLEAHYANKFDIICVNETWFSESEALAHNLKGFSHSFPRSVFPMRTSLFRLCVLFVNVVRDL